MRRREYVGASRRRELSEKTGVTIVIDRRLGGQAKTPVTATIRRAKLLDAVGLLADQVDARAVIRGEVLYVTSPENGRRLQEEAETPRRQAMPGP